MSRMSIALVSLSLVMFAPAASAGTYTGGQVAQGGTITGTVSTAGARGAKKKLKVTKDHGTCGHSKDSEAVIVGPSGGLANAVVYIDAIKAGKPAPKTTVVLNQKGCTYVPHVQAAVRGSKIELQSSDPILHNVHGALGGKRLLFNVAMPTKGQRIKKKLKKAGVVEITCDAGHTWMKAYVHVLDHPYFAVTGADGSFTIADVPPGTYKVVVWHETFGRKKASVTVTAGGTAKTSFALR